MEIKILIVGPLLTNCYLLISDNEATVIDPGAGLKRILKELKNKRLNYIILTHHHWDHTLAARKLRDATHPPPSRKLAPTGAKILIGRGEKDFIKFKADKFLEDKEKIKIWDSILEVLDTPGHTRGSICLVGKNFIFTGDTLFKDGYGRTDLPGSSQKDLENSLIKLKKFLKPGTIVYPGHGETFRF